jgi:hypothetical protein
VTPLITTCAVSAPLAAVTCTPFELPDSVLPDNPTCVVVDPAAEACTPVVPPAIRLAAIATDAPLDADTPIPLLITLTLRSAAFAGPATTTPILVLSRIVVSLMVTVAPATLAITPVLSP